MKAKEVLAHFKEVGTWVDWNNTCDEILHGDPDMEIKGIATAWLSTNAALRQAAAKGHNLFITHEPSFYGLLEQRPNVKLLADQKRALLDEHNITLMRCHDTWDRMPKVGVADAWASFLGFKTEPRPLESFYRICLLGEYTLKDAAQRILEKVKPLGQDTVLILGDHKLKVNRLAIGTGAATDLPKMYELKPDVILATDDGMNFWEGGSWILDMGLPLLIVNHATAEKPGMQALATYLTKQFPQIPAEYIDVALPYSSL